LRKNHLKQQIQNCYITIYPATCSNLGPIISVASVRVSVTPKPIGIKTTKLGGMVIYSHQIVMGGSKFGGYGWDDGWAVNTGDRRRRENGNAVGAKSAVGAKRERA